MKHTLRQKQTQSIRMKQAANSAKVINCRNDQRFDPIEVKALTWEELDNIPSI